MKVRIEITEQDIENGAKYNATRCPTSIAALRAVRALGLKVHCVTVGSVTMHFVLVGSAMPIVRVQQPKELQSWIASFDRGDKVQPAAFEIELEGF